MRRRMRTMALQAAAPVAIVLTAAALVGCGQRTVNQTASTGPAPAPVEIRVSAATTLKDVLEELAPSFEAEHDVKVVFNFGPSGQLQKQIEGGAPADAFLSASPAQVDALVEGGHVSADDADTFASNDLVIFVPAGNPGGVDGPGDLAGAERLVTGNPETAPFGAKTQEWLEGLGMWHSLQPRFVFAENAAQALDYVARGEVGVGIGFRSEALRSDAVEIVYLVPADEIDPIRYVAAPLADAAEPRLADAFVEFLMGDGFQAALARAGFNEAPVE